MINVSQRIADAPTLVMDGLRRHFTAAMLFAVLQLGDIMSTHIGLRSDLSETNPFAVSLLTTTGEMSMYAAKLAMITIFLASVCLLEARHARIWRAVYVTNAVMMLIVFTNTIQLFL